MHVGGVVLFVGGWNFGGWGYCAPLVGFFVLGGGHCLWYLCAVDVTNVDEW